MVTLAHAQPAVHFFQGAFQGAYDDLCIPLRVFLLADVCGRRQLMWRVVSIHFDEPMNCFKGTNCLPSRSCFEPLRTTLTETNCYSSSSYEVFKDEREPPEPFAFDGPS